MKVSVHTTYAVPATALSIVADAGTVYSLYTERSRQCCVNYYAQLLRHFDNEKPHHYYNHDCTKTVLKETTPKTILVKCHPTN